MHGETSGLHGDGNREEGPSPCARGNLRGRRSRNRGVGTIPVCTGKPFLPHSRHLILGDHPRVHGETSATSAGESITTGPSPCARGKPSCPVIHDYLSKDHPRVHGENRIEEVFLDGLPGTIPVCTGKPNRPHPLCRFPRDHPRVHGETVHKNINGAFLEGPSPCARGNLSRSETEVRAWGTIPVCTGKPALPCSSATLSRDHPRVHGETAFGKIRRGCLEGPSPCARGNRLRLQYKHEDYGTIPVCTGKP